MAAKCLLAYLWMPVLFIESRNVGGGTGLREKVRVQFLAMWSLKSLENTEIGLSRLQVIFVPGAQGAGQSKNHYG